MSAIPPAGAPPRTLGFWTSLAWGVAAIVAWLGAQFFLGDLLAEWFDRGSGGDISWLASHAPFVGLVTIGTAIMPLAVVALAVRTTRAKLADYLALRAPRREYAVLGAALLAVLIPLVDTISWFAGQAVTPQFVLDLYTSARNEGALLLLAVALVVAAPLVEETLFRGFLLPGFAASPLRPWGAILVTSLLWALLHAQYQPFYLAQIVALGVLFGWLRLRSGSTVLTMGLHGLVNLVSLVQAAVIAEWMS